MNEQLSPVKRAILEIRELKARLERIEHDAAEPIAVVGIGCRFPGSDGPAAYWRMLRDGIDAIREVPKDRWDADAYYDPNPDAPGKIYARHGGFLDRVDQFDAAFFGISPREAVHLDPQQRLLLEVAWESLEHAAMSPEQLVGSKTGVFVGVCTNEYASLHLTAAEPVNAYFGTGNAASVAAGRLSYYFGWQGPSIALDTACSSSLVAVHLAVNSLRRNECGMALAGGVNLMLRPETTVNFCRARMLAADGRCKTFDAAADGYSRAEGAGLVVLKRLSHAIADGDQVLALVLGSAVNQDGRSGGLTVPNGAAQQAVVRDALADARVQPVDVQYIEAHGTGTALGDPIEVHSLRAVLGDGRTASQPLLIGSVKTNVGHLEAAAGVAGLAKVVLAMQHGEIPKHLHFRELNPQINVQGAPIEVTRETRPWPPAARRLAGVSSFGFSGTNAHVVMAAAPAPPDRAPTPRDTELIVVSARTSEALRAVATRLADHLVSDAAPALGDVAFTLAAGRAHLAHRAAFIVRTHAELVAQLRAFADRRQAAIATGELLTLDPQAPVLACLDTDALDASRLAALRTASPPFARALDAVIAELQPAFGSEWAAALGADRPPAATDRDRRLATFVYQHALGAVLESWGVAPLTLTGCGAGAYVAASLAGAISIVDAAKVLTGGAALDAARLTAPHTALASARDGAAVTVPSLARWLDDERHSPGSLGAAFEGPVMRIGGGGDPAKVWPSLLESMARGFCEGVHVSWREFYSGQDLRRVVLPTYPFERQRYWVEVAAAPAMRESAAPRVEDRDEVLSLDTVRTSIQETLEDELSRAGLEIYANAIGDLEQLATTYAVSAMASLGWREQPGARLDVDEFADRLAVVAAQRTLFRQILRFLAEDGILKADGAAYIVQRSLPHVDADAARNRFAELNPASVNEMTLVTRCGTFLAAVLQGRKQPLEVLFPGGSAETVELVYAKSPIASFYQTLAGRVVSEMIRTVPPSRVVRVLEIGAGTGATTAAILPALTRVRSRYVYSDLSPVFLHRAAEKFSDYPSVEYALFDVERPADEQPLPIREFDLIIAANVVHATSDVRQSMTRLQSMLAPGGVVMLVEATTPRRWLDLTFGLTDGWWKFSDRSLRATSPLLSRESWLSVMAASGLQDGTAVAAANGADHPALFLGRRAPRRPNAEVRASFLDRFTNALASEREDLLIGFVRDHLRGVLRLPETTVVHRRHRLVDLGLDSLMVLEFRNRVESELGWKDVLPATLVFDYPTIEALANFLTTRMAAPAAATVTPQPVSVAPAVSDDELEALADLSDDEVMALLEKKLETL